MLNQGFVRALVLSVLLQGVASCTALFDHFSGDAGVTIKQSISDDRSFRYITLSNQLKVLLISDAEAERAAASLDVHVGSRDEPNGYEGLAHFLEHMLFLGTARYPSPDEYQQFISQHGGSRNAYTSFEHTNYFFEVNNAAFEAALDRFADFFIAPTFDAAYIEREMQAVDSEYSASLDNEKRRILDATRQIINPAHPYAKFSGGNLQTLSRPDIRQALLDFYDTYYSASRMSLAVTGAYSLDALEQMVRGRFSAIKNNSSQAQSISQPFFSEASAIQLPAVLAVKTNKPLRQLHMSFPLPDIKPHEAAKPLHYIGNILGHEGQNSLLSALKKAGLAESLSTGVGIEYSGGALYQVNLVLSDKGMSNINQVAAALFQTIAAIRNELVNNLGAAQERFSEQKQLADIGFRFYEHRAATSAVISASSNLQYYPPKDVLFAPYNFSRFDAELIDALLQLLNPDNILLTIASNQIPEAMPPVNKTRWYEVDYSVQAVIPQWLASWWRAVNGEALDGMQPVLMPAPNQFIADDFTLYNSQSKVDEPPALITRVPGFELWSKTDDKFELPRLDLRVAYLSDYAAGSPRRQAMASLYASVVGEQLKEFIYPAYLAGMQASFYPTLRGFSLSVSGYNDSVSPLLGSMLQSLGELTISEPRFDELRAELKRKWQLAMQVTPYHRLGAYLGTQLYSQSSDYPALIQAVGALSYDKLQTYVDEFWPTTYVQALLHGNTDAKQTGEVLRLLSDGGLPRCSCESDVAQQVQIKHLAAGAASVPIALPHSDKAIIWYFQSPDNSLQSTALAMLSAAIVKPTLFNELRTEQQLGYIVDTSYYPLHTWPGISVTVQSPQFTEAELAAAIEQFFAEFIQQSVSIDEFERHRNALLDQLVQDDRNLSARTGRYWSVLMRNHEQFDYRQQLASVLSQIDLPTWQAHLATLVGEGRHSLQVTTQQR